MKREAYVGIDIGTSGVKATIVDGHGRIQSSSRIGYDLVRDRDGSVSLSPALIVNSFHRAVGKLDVTGYDIEAITVASFGEAVVLLDRDLNPVGDVVMYSDNRGQSHAQVLETEFGDAAAYEHNGCGISYAYTLPRLMWIRDHEPALFQQTTTILPVADFLIMHLTGEVAVSRSLAARTMAYDLARDEWFEDILNAAGIEHRIFPTIVPIGQNIGNVRHALQDSIGLGSSVKVVAGGHDQIFAAIGAGLHNFDQATDGLGSVECLTAMVPADADLDEMRRYKLAQVPYLPDSAPVTYGYTLGGGDLVSWFARNIYYGADTELSTDAISAMLAGSAESSAGVTIIPHLNGSGTPYLDGSMSAAILNVRSHVTKSNLVRALIEGMNAELLVNLQCFHDSGLVPTTLLATGGGTSSTTMMQAKAQLLDLPVRVCETADGGALGAAIVAAAGIGRFETIQSGMREWVRYRDEFAPNRNASIPFSKGQEMSRYTAYHKALFGKGITLAQPGPS
ncbi:MAG: FGGY-family carbohydrate kinase [Alkalispirochaeta sp.]